MECPNCQSQVGDEARFCSACGSKLEAGGEPKVTAQEESEAPVEQALTPPPCESLQTVPVAVPAPPPPAPAFPPAVHVHYPSRVEMAAPVPSVEQPLWEGRQSFWYYVPGMIWAGLWFVVWLGVGSFMAGLIAAAKGIAPQEWAGLMELLSKHVSRCAWGAYALALLALWGIVRRILAYFSSYVHITTQRIKIKQGIFSQTVNQIELFRLKDAELEKPLFGRLLGYAHIRLISSDRFATYTQVPGLPDGERQLDMIRVAAQHARAESGTVSISE